MRAVAHAVVIRIAGYSIRRIGQNFVNEDIAARVAQELHRHRIAVAPISL